MIIDYNNPDCFCPYCDELFNEDGTCTNYCAEELDLDFLDVGFLDDFEYHDDLYDIIPGYDYVLEDSDNDE